MGSEQHNTATEKGRPQTSDHNSESQVRPRACTPALLLFLIVVNKNQSFEAPAGTLTPGGIGGKRYYLITSA